MEAIAKQPDKRDAFLLCLYEKISSRLPGQFCHFDIVLTTVSLSGPARLPYKQAQNAC
jgi:hypothetical protein